MANRRQPPQPTVVTDPSELADLETLRQQIQILDIIYNKMPTTAVDFPQKGSSLYGDDRWTYPHQLSHVARSSLGVALDQLRGLDNLIHKAGSLHPYASFSLIRSAIENGATAVWLLAPTSRPERVKRRLQLLTSDAYNAEKLRKAMPNWKVNSSLTDDLKAIADIAKEHEIGKPERLQMTEIVRLAGDEVKERGISVEGGWQITSGITHGQIWAIHTLLTREIEDDAGDVVDALVKAGVRQVVWGVECARLVIQHGHDLLMRRAASLIG